MEISFQYRITYDNDQTYERKNQIKIPVSKEEYKTVMLGIAQGLLLEEIENIDEVISRMKEEVLELDCYFNRDGTYRAKRLKKPRTINGMELFIPQTEYQRIKKMSDPEAVFDRTEEHLTLYRNDGSHVILSSENGKITVKDSRKISYAILDVDHFLSRIG